MEGADNQEQDAHSSLNHAWNRAMVSLSCRAARREQMSAGTHCGHDSRQRRRSIARASDTEADASLRGTGGMI